MKYKHYAPKASVVLLKGSTAAYIDFVNNHIESGTAALCYDDDIEKLKLKSFSLGKSGDYSSQAHRLFSSLRAIDRDESVKLVYARCPNPEGVGMAVYNRLVRAAGFEVIDLENL